MDQRRISVVSAGAACRREKTREEESLHLSGMTRSFVHTHLVDRLRHHNRWMRAPYNRVRPDARGIDIASRIGRVPTTRKAV
jgi:hypothetical protein